MIVDHDGVIHFANEQATACLAGTDGQPVTGRSMLDVMGMEIAGERLTLVRRVIQAGHPITCDGQIKGVMMRCVMRQFPMNDGAPRAIIVARPFSPEMKPDSATEYVRAQHDDPGPLKELTDREIEILRLIGEGLATSAIAQKLGRSVKTVEWHRVSLGEKLGVANRVELARIAIRAGLVGVAQAS
ncbi:MAG: LuxR C-terminal-related transcriptional regulator [Phycisphaerales bacterium]|nr:LuxR C-terminal-related transcriptional regulator [Phycisphaerales bacterium]